MVPYVLIALLSLYTGIKVEKQSNALDKKERIQQLTQQIDLLDKDGKITLEDIKNITNAAPADLINDESQNDERAIFEEYLFNMLTKMKNNQDYKDNLKRQRAILQASSQQEALEIEAQYSQKRFNLTKDIEAVNAKLQAAREKKAAAQAQAEKKSEEKAA